MVIDGRDEGHEVVDGLKKSFRFHSSLFRCLGCKRSSLLAMDASDFIPFRLLNNMFGYYSVASQILLQYILFTLYCTY